MKAHQRVVVDWLAGIGASGVCIEPPRGCGHPRLVFTFRGREHRTNIASSPSDHRAPYLKIRDLRHALGLTVRRKPRAAGDRRASRRRPASRPPQPADLRPTRFLPTYGLPPLNTPFAGLADLLAGEEAA